jgi:hypothetical protein
MKYPEEDIAADLHRELMRRLASAHTSLAIQGAGVHWHCTASRGNSLCSIACFTSLGPEYYTDFQRDFTKIATSRIPSRDQTIAAIADWLDGMELAAFYRRYSFVDKTKRALCQLRDDVFAAAPVLQRSASCQLEHRGADIFYLRFRVGERACEISFYGKNALPDAKFSWDDCQLFQFQPEDHAQLASVLTRWLCDQAPPSAIRMDFPWLHIGELADYYESGTPVEGEFVQSWDFIEEFYREDWCNFSIAVLDMIHAMRIAGYDRVLRAGQSMSSLGLSRSRRHGLKGEQASLWFEFHPPVMDVHATFAGGGLKNHPIQFTEEVERLMAVLVDVEID